MSSTITWSVSVDPGATLDRLSAEGLSPARLGLLAGAVALVGAVAVLVPLWLWVPAPMPPALPVDLGAVAGALVAAGGLVQVLMRHLPSWRRRCSVGPEGLRVGLDSRAWGQLRGYRVDATVDGGRRVVVLGPGQRPLVLVVPADLFDSVCAAVATQLPALAPPPATPLPTWSPRWVLTHALAQLLLAVAAGAALPFLLHAAGALVKPSVLVGLGLGPGVCVEWLRLRPQHREAWVSTWTAGMAWNGVGLSVGLLGAMVWMLG